MAHLLLRHTPQLLLHKPPVETQGSRSYPQIVAERLRAARQGAWLPLVEQLIVHLVDNPPRPPMARLSEPSDPVDARQAQAAAVKARHGTLKAAAAALRPSQAVAPSPEVTQAVAGLFQTERRTPDQEAAFQAAMDAARRLPMDKQLQCPPRA